MKQLTEKEANEIWKNKILFSHGKRGIVSKSPNGKYLIKEKKPESFSPGTIRNEYEFNLKLNKINIGPRIIYYDDKHDFLIREFVNGETIYEYFEKIKKELSKNAYEKEIKRIILNIFEQCRRMDVAKINKFEMTNPYKDLIIDEKTGEPVIIDFERCRHSDKTKNTTQFCQFLMKGKMKLELEQLGVFFKAEEIISLAEEYKKEQSENNFKKIIKEIEEKCK
jgi:putative serine/threonine protein kinase